MTIHETKRIQKYEGDSAIISRKLFIFARRNSKCKKIWQQQPQNNALLIP